MFPDGDYSRTTNKMKSYFGLSVLLALMIFSDVLSLPFVLEIEEGFIRKIETAHKCRQCIGEDCLIPPESCRFGTYLDKCGHINCFQGPGDFCHSDQTGIYRCAKQLSCLCSECHGCLKDPESGEFQCNTALSCHGMTR